MSELAYASGAEEGSLSGSGTAFREEQAHRDLALGVRAYVPLLGPLSLFIDLLGGASHCSTYLERKGLGAVSSSGWHAAGMIAGGLQVRLVHHLSIGLRTKVVLGEDGRAALRSTASSETFARSAATAGLTWHF